MKSELWAWDNQLIKLCIVHCYLECSNLIVELDPGTHIQSPVRKTRAHSSRMWMEGLLMQRCRRMREFSHPGMQGPWKYGNTESQSPRFCSAEESKQILAMRDPPLIDDFPIETSIDFPLQFPPEPWTWGCCGKLRLRFCGSQPCWPQADDVCNCLALL